jgi:hypothetical protein
MPRSTAVLDACVLVPIALADTMLRVAEKGLYRPLWSDRILREAQLAIEEIYPGIGVGQRFDSVREAFGDALVTGWEALEPRIELPDQDDRHVVAAAVCGGADAVITVNLGDFPVAALSPLRLRRYTPTTSCSTNWISAHQPSWRSFASKLPKRRILRLPRESWPLSSAGQAYPASPTRCSA